MIFFKTLSIFLVLSVSSVSSQDVMNRPNLKKNCGVVADGTSLIVNGVDVKPGNWPWLVALLERKNIREENHYFCSGVLVSLSKVLTAAHCIQNKRSKTRRLNREILVLLGAHDISNLLGNGMSIMSPSDIRIHPDWDSNNPRYDADIAAILFEYEVPYNQVIRPICLSSLDLNIDKGTVAGWGDEGGDRTTVRTTTPKQVTVPIVTNEDCFLESDGFSRFSSKRTFCAGSRNGSGVCFGDSGAGLFAKEGDAFYLKGIVSSAAQAKDKGCNVHEYALYTNVDFYKSWIRNPTGESEEDEQEIERSGTSSTSRLPVSCGIINSSKSLIHSGSSAIREEFPWTVAVFYNEDGINIFVSTGSLVSSKHVVTPGQTYLVRNNYLNNPNHVHLYFGVIDFDENLSRSSKYVNGVESIRHHPNNVQGLPKIANIAVLVMRKAIKFNDYISPVCIPQGPINIARNAGRAVFSVGWGFDNSGLRSRLRNFVKVKIRSKEICDDYQLNQKFREVEPTYFCAGSDGFKAAGTGDDPLYYKRKNRWDLIGLLVYGDLESAKIKLRDTPILYEDVGAFKQWIEDVINE